MIQASAASDTLFLPIRELSRRIRAREFSPVALTEAALERLERLGPRYNAVVTLMRESATVEALQAEREIGAGHLRGPLHGMPYGAKDLLATRLAPTPWGAAPYREQIFEYDATVVERLRSAGAILVAKLAMVELAGGLGYDQADAVRNLLVAQSAFAEPKILLDHQEIERAAVARKK